MTMLRSQNGGILLCCGKDKCPLVKLDGETQLTITDDNGNTVKLDVDQAKLLTQAIDQLEQEK